MADEPETRSTGGVSASVLHRVIALEIRSRRFGFAVFDGAELIDYGGSVYPPGKQGVETAARRMAALLDLHSPALVVARPVRRVRDPWSKQAGGALRSVRAESQRRNVPLQIVARRDVVRSFAEYGIRKKYDIAQAVAKRFQEVQWRLPPPRKPWNREADAIAVFDAVATFVAWSGGANVIALRQD